MLYVFMDEKDEKLGHAHRFLSCCTGFLKNDWHSCSERIRGIGSLSKHKRLEQISRVLDDYNGFAVLTYADVPNELVQSGGIDRTLDVARMSRTNNIWSQCFVFSSLPVLAMFHRTGVSFSEIDVHYDEKTITMDHREAIKKTFKEEVSSIVNEKIRRHGLNTGKQVAINNVYEVGGFRNLMEATDSQLGVSISHHICTQSRRLIPDFDSPHLKLSKATDAVLLTLNQFSNPTNR